MTRNDSPSLDSSPLLTLKLPSYHYWETSPFVSVIGSACFVLFLMISPISEPQGPHMKGFEVFHITPRSGHIKKG